MTGMHKREAIFTFTFTFVFAMRTEYCMLPFMPLARELFPQPFKLIFTYVAS